MKTSTVKLYEFLEELQSYPDSEIEEAVGIGIPAPVLRGALAGLAGRVPDDPAELDLQLTRMGDFCHNLRSDSDEPAPTA